MGAPIPARYLSGAIALAERRCASLAASGPTESAAAESLERALERALEAPSTSGASSSRQRGPEAGGAPTPHQRLRALAPRLVPPVGLPSAGGGLTAVGAGAAATAPAAGVLAAAAISRRVLLDAFAPPLQLGAGSRAEQSESGNASDDEVMSDSASSGGGGGGGGPALRRPAPPPLAVRDWVVARRLRRAVDEAERDAGQRALAVLAGASSSGLLLLRRVNKPGAPGSPGGDLFICDTGSPATSSSSSTGSPDRLQLFAVAVCVGRWGLLKEASTAALRAEAEAEAALAAARGAARRTVETLHEAVAANTKGGE